MTSTGKQPRAQKHTQAELRKVAARIAKASELIALEADKMKAENIPHVLIENRQGVEDGLEAMRKFLTSCRRHIPEF